MGDNAIISTEHMQKENILLFGLLNAQTCKHFWEIILKPHINESGGEL